jgi:DNA-binding transcriptional ArsR family regulator
MIIYIASIFLIYIIIPFCTGLVITFILLRIHNKTTDKGAEKHYLELKILDMEKQIKEQREKINLLSEQIEIIFNRTNRTNTKIDENILNKIISQYHAVSPDSTHVSNPNIMQSKIQTDNNNILSPHSQLEAVNDDDHHNSTIEYILKKLDNNSLTTRELQRSIGRTREHTSRLMKKLYDNKLVDRDMDSKPFKYTITNEGRKRLIKHSVSKNNYHSDLLKNPENLTDGLTEIRYPENLNSN